MKCNGNDVCIIKIRVLWRTGGGEEQKATRDGDTPGTNPGLNSGFCFRLTCRDMNSLSAMFSEPVPFCHALFQ